MVGMQKNYPYHPLCCRFLLVQEKSNGFQWNWSLICIQIKMQVFQYVFHSLTDFLHSHDGIFLTLPSGYCTFCKPYLNQHGGHLDKIWNISSNNTVSLIWHRKVSEILLSALENVTLHPNEIVVRQGPPLSWSWWKW